MCMMWMRLNGATSWRAAAYWEAGAQALPHDATLVVCLLACWQCREAVLPADLLRWAASGELPYLGMAEAVRGVRESAGEHALPEQLVRPQGARPVWLHLSLLVFAATHLPALRLLFNTGCVWIDQ